MKSIAVTLQGGLGNQMFQYALGRALAHRTNLPLVLECRRLRTRDPGVPVRDYELDCFRLSPFRKRDPPLWWTRAMARLASGQTTRIVEGPDLAFEPAILEIRGACHLEGYWQSERYFEAVAEQLREDFTFQRPPLRRAAAFLQRIEQSVSVAVNFRRKDFVDSPFHGTCSSEYYEAALKWIVERLGRDIELFIVSDEIEWCRQNVRFPFPTTFVDLEAQEPDYELMRLMSACRALVGANSTFSWWSGWLNPRPDKIVIAPRRWFAKPGLVSDLPNSPWLTAL